MRDEVEKGGRRLRIVPFAAWSLTAIMSGAIVFNVLFCQPATGRISESVAGGPGDPAAAEGARTIQLRYDPVVEAVQRELLQAGYYKGPVDGVNGRRTKQAITAYQQAMGLETDGKPSDELAEHIRFTREVSEASLFTGTVAAAPDAEQRAAVRRVQTALSDLAYSPGEINGELTRDTRNAIIAFQHDNKLPETGEVTEQLLAELAKAGNQAASQSASQAGSPSGPATQ